MTPPSRSPRALRTNVAPAVLEAVLVIAGVLASTHARLGWAPEGQEGWPLQVKALIVSAVWLGALYYADLYERRTTLDRQLTAVRVVKAWSAAAVTLAVLYYWFPSAQLGRGVMTIALVVLPLLAFAWRQLIDWSLRRHGARERLLIVGTSDESIGLARELHDRRHEFALEIVGFVDPDPSRVGMPLFNPGIVGALGGLARVIEARETDRVAISTLTTIEEMSLDEVVRLRFSGVTFDHFAQIYEEYTGKLAIAALTPMSLMSSVGFRRHSWLLTSKRLVDVVMALVGLTLAAPLMLVAALAIRLTSRGPVLYVQQRVGEDGRVFTMYKFRSMTHDAERETGPVWARQNDARVTRVGRLLRRTRFDEIPQLWNVLRGDMSVVGPRPERPELDVQLLRDIPLYAQRRLVKPGITGWAQVRHAYGASVDDARVKLQYDLFYIKNMSAALDVLILLMTTKTVLRGGGAR